VDKTGELRERYGRRYLPRLFPRGTRGTEDEQSEIRERYLGIGIAFGTGFGMVIGASLGVVFGNLALGIGFGICVGTGLGIAVGSSLGNKHTSAIQRPSETRGSRDT
jgi:hypothetical protein